MDMKQRVELGCEMLDDWDTYWFTKIDVYSLVMKSHTDCILGQLFGNCNTQTFTDDSEYSLAELGFDLYDEEYGMCDAWNELTVAWEDAIDERMELASV